MNPEDVCTSSVIVSDLDVDRAGRAFRPLKANPPLVIDADAVLALPIALQSFQPIARQSGEVFEGRRPIQSVKTDFRLSRETGKFPNALAICKAFGFAIPVADDHRPGTYPRLRFT